MDIFATLHRVSKNRGPLGPGLTAETVSDGHSGTHSIER